VPVEGHVTSDLKEALGHGVGEPAVAREVGRKAVVEQIHQPRVGPQFANDASIGTIECFRAWMRAMRMLSVNITAALQPSLT